MQPGAGTPTVQMSCRQGNADLWPVLPVGAGTAARSAAKGVYHAPVRMTLNAGVPAERRTTPELGVLSAARFGGLCRPEVGVPLPAGRDARWGTCREGRHDGGWVCAVRSPPGSCADRRSAFPCLRVALHGGVRPRRASSPNCTFMPAALPRVPGPTGSTDRRSAFPCRRVAPSGGLGSHAPCSASAWHPSATRRALPSMRNTG